MNWGERDSRDQRDGRDRRTSMEGGLGDAGLWEGTLSPKPLMLLLSLQLPAAQGG